MYKIIGNGVSFLLILNCFNLIAQKSPKKFGDVDLKSVEMNTYPIDSNAEAVVLFDFGLTRFQYVKSQGFELIFQRHKRIKILRSDGYKYATVEIPVYRSGNSKEEVRSIKAYTYNTEDGTLEKVKLSKKSIIEEEVDKHWSNIKFTLPNVMEGSVIGYSYEIASDFIFNLQSWPFQDFIPTVYSEYNVKIPEYFYYQKVSKGYHPIEVNRSQSNGTITLTSKSRSEGTVTQTSFQSSVINYSTNDQQFVVRNVPAMTVEPHMTTPYNYMSKIEFELERTQFPQQPVETFMESWSQLNEKYLENEFFGKQVKGSGFLKKEVENLDLAGKTSEEKVASIFDHLRSKMSWNGYYSRYVGSNLKRPYEDGKGNVSEINLTLASMLNKAGIKADPVLLSTRRHGYVNEAFAKSDQFNYVICKAYLSDDKYLLLDATSKSLPVGRLPRRCLNGNGWVVSANNPGWININKYVGSTSKTIESHFSLDSDGILAGNVHFVYKGYEAESQRSNYWKDKDSYAESYRTSTSLDVSEAEIKNDDELDQPFEVTIEVESLDEQSDMIYFHPFMYDDLKENPFKKEKRDFPVDFTYPFKKQLIVSLELDESYEVVEIPEPKILTLPNGAGKFMYQVTQMTDKISIVSLFSINKSVFVPEEYPYLKSFYDQALAKKNEVIVIKRK